jgi:alkaline phosphatase
MKPVDSDLKALAARGASLLAAAVVVCILALAGCASGGESAAAIRTPRNIIIMFADGATSTQWEFGRYSSRVLRQQPFVSTDVVFRSGALGLMTTSPHDAYVTDSAAAASAMSTGSKVKNFTISVTPDGKSPRTVMEAAKAAGKRIGLVTTATVYDATPAAFSLHTASRGNSQALVDQFLALEPDVLMGGGADYFLPAGTPGGKRIDGRDIVAAFRGKG